MWRNLGVFHGDLTTSLILQSDSNTLLHTLSYCCHLSTDRHLIGKVFLVKV